MVAQLGFVAKGLNLQYHPLRAVLLRMYPFFFFICDDSRKSASHIYTIPQKDQSQLRFLVVVNKVQTSSLGHTLWGSVSDLTRNYRADFDTICNDPRKNTSHICAIPQKDQSQLRLLVVVNKVLIYLVNTRCETHHTSAHITQSIKLGYHNIESEKFPKFGPINASNQVPRN